MVTPFKKQPAGYLSLGTAHVQLPQQKRKPELTIAVASDFFAWELMAQFTH
jgi:hypothetical protein